MSRPGADVVMFVETLAKSSKSCLLTGNFFSFVGIVVANETRKSGQLKLRIVASKTVKYRVF